MEKTFFQIIKYIAQVLLAIGVLWGLVVLSVNIVAPTSKIPTASKKGFKREYVISELTNELGHFNLDLPSRKESTITLEEREIITLQLVKALQKKNIEVYRLVEGENISLHIYDQNEKIFLLSFTSPEKKTAVNNISSVSEIKQSKSIAIVLAGIGNKDIRILTAIKRPLNFAISPYQPFSLRTAQQAAHHWHEVLIDHREIKEDAWDSLPFYSGVLVEEAASPLSAYIDVLSEKSPKLVTFPLERPLDIAQLNWIWEEALLKTKKHQTAIILIDIAEKDTSDLVFWLENLPKNISLALLSEV